MAKEKAAAETTELTTFDPSLLDGLTAEEIAELYGTTGQEAVGGSFEKVPSIRVNKYAKKDVNGKSIPVGEWVYNQRIKVEGDKKTCEDIGESLGLEPVVIIHKVARQYSFWNEDAKLRCNSQILLASGDVPIGNNLGFNCSAKEECPRRAKGAAKTERCSCQLVIAGTVDGKPFLNYIKGESFIPVQDYISSLGQTPIFAVKTRLKYEEKSKGENDYYVWKPESAGMVSQIEFRANFDQAKEVHKNMEAFRAQQMKKANQKSIGHVTKDSPANVTIVNSEDDGIRFD
jgi:hypothetical protein